MEKVFKFLFVGASVLMHWKASVWFFTTLLVASLIENGGNDAEFHLATQLVLIIGFMLTVLSLALTVHYQRERKSKPAKNFPGHSSPPPPPAKTPGFSLPPMGPPVNFPTDPRDVFPHFPIDNHSNDKA